jgi:hypothetical protein
MDRRPTWFLTGLFFTTLATLCLEVLDTRLLSVMSWYHLSFFAVSTAMFGMSAGALRVYLGGAEFAGEQAERALSRYAVLLAISIPISHAANLVILLPEGSGTATIVAFTVTTVALAFPFYMSGVVVTLALTRIPGRIGLAYAVDLLGASLGALLVLPALAWTNLSAATLLCAALAALAAACFQLHAGRRLPLGIIVLAALLLAGMIANVKATPANRLMPWSSKGKTALEGKIEILDERWNIHSQVMLLGPPWKKPGYWGPGKGTEEYNGKVETLRMVIDGNAATWMTSWDGNPASLEWVKHDVTSLPYHLRKDGDAAIIGVGGGRDLLTALWARSRSVKGVEINSIFLDILQTPIAEGGRREFTRIAERPEVELVHDEARSYLTRTTDRYDVLQMSLIDTWAATGAGAFTLTENGLYTLEGWDVFLRVLKPTGVFSVSRWYDPENASETSRLLALGTAALLDRGIERPADHMILVAVDKVATLLVSLTAFPAQDLALVDQTCETYGFKILVAPGRTGISELERIVGANSRPALDAAIANADYDYSPPTDERPFFFNILRPASYLHSLTRGAEAVDEARQGVLTGNLKATGTLLALFLLSLVLVVLVIVVPLVRSGLPRMSGGSFLCSILYFACIGFGFMLVQVPLMQRFSVYLGHPTYAVVVILFSMILSAGIGSFVSDRVPAEQSTLAVVLYPLAIAAVLFGVTQAIQPVIDHTIESGFALRTLLVIVLVAPASLLLGLCFPIGMRLVRRISTEATAWMWGVNGACGVLGAVIAVGISMWGGIQLNLLVATGLYAVLVLVTPILRASGTRSGL